MKEIVGNVFDLAYDPDVDSVCITTNGMVNRSGNGIMGAGIALEASKRWPRTPANLGRALRVHGNFPYVIGMIDKSGQYQNPTSRAIKEKDFGCLVWSFPTKNDWRNNSTLELIEQSARILVNYVNLFSLNKVCMPRPGCQNGGLKWIQVKQILEPILDDRFLIVTLDGEK